MKVLVCGSRHFQDKELLYKTLDELNHSDNNRPLIYCIIHGAAKGADTLAGSWAKDRDVFVEEYPANWNFYGPAAGPIRNREMIDKGEPDLVIAFLAKDSKGTKNMIEQATKNNIPVRVINI